MKFRIAASAALIALFVAAGGYAYAQVAVPPISPPPTIPIAPPPPGDKTAPQVFLVPAAHSLPAYYSFNVLPYNFSFDDELVGQGFQPNEQVTITRVSAAGKSTSSTTADTSGNFSVAERYQWMYCAAGAKPSPPPNFVAEGSEGSSASVSRQATPCPFLQAFGRATSVDNGPSGAGGGTSGSGSANSSGSVTSPPATIVPPGNPIPPGPGTPPDTIAVLPPQLAKVSIEGFGFMPGEGVTLGESQDVQLHPATGAVQTKADAEGRFQITLPMYVPAPCSYFWFPTVTATGNKGTSAMTRVLWHSPLMIACPVHAPPGGDAPVVPGTTVSQNSSDNAVFTDVALHLQAKVAAGSTEKARVSTDAAGSLSLTVSYPGGRHTTLRATTQGKTLSLKWKVPKAAKAGTAKVNLAFQPAGGSSSSRVSLLARFKVAGK